MVIRRAFHDLVSTVDLLYEYKKSERVWHDEVREPQSSIGDTGEKLEIYPIASADDKSRIFTHILRVLEHFGEFARLYALSSLIE
jgi:hypothetical protein